MVKLSEIIKNALAISLMAGLLYTFNSVMHNGYLYENSYRPNLSSPIQRCHRTRPNLVNLESAPNKRALSYLKLAFFMFRNNIQKNPGRMSVCESCSDTVYTAFLKLLDETNQKRLDKYVRLACGRHNKTGTRHDWLEVNIGNEWIHFEPTIRVDAQIGHIDTSSTETLNKVDSLCPNEIYLRPSGECTRFWTHQVLNGQTVRNLDIGGCLLDYRGMVYDTFFNDDNRR